MEQLRYYFVYQDNLKLQNKSAFNARDYSVALCLKIKTPLLALTGRPWLVLILQGLSPLETLYLSPATFSVFQFAE